MSKIRLSICMPTYNFGTFIGATLDSILCQMQSDMEIIIVDGGSTDNTEEVVKSYQQINSQIIYHRLQTRGGIDNDMAISVSLASGEYCWLFSSDDIMKSDAIINIYKQIAEQHDIYICSFTIHSLDFKKIICKHPIFNTEKDVVYDMKNPIDKNIFFEQAITTTAFFSFMSSLIFKRALWDKAQNVDEFYGGCWAHAARFFSILSQLKIKYLHDVYLEKRNDNDSFMDKGIIHRMGISIYGWNAIANRFLGPKSREAFYVRKVLRNEWPFHGVKSIQSLAKNDEEKNEMKNLIQMVYSDKTWECLESKALLIYPFFMALFFKAVKFIRQLPFRVYRKILKIYNAQLNRVSKQV